MSSQSQRNSTSQVIEVASQGPVISSVRAALGKRRVTRCGATLTLLSAAVGMVMSGQSAYGAIGIFAGTGGDPYWDGDASNWTGVSGNAWDALNGPTNVAQFNAGNANPTTAGTAVANGIIWNNTSGGVAGGNVTLAGTTPFINVTTSGLTSQMFANLTGTNGFTKTGAGQFFLIDTVKGITGGITVNQGLLRLDLNTAATISGVANSANSLTLSGSTVELQGRGGGAASSQTLSDFTLNTGGSTIRLNRNGGSGVTLSLANWTRASGTNASLLIDTSSGAGNTVTLTGTLPTLSNGIIGGYATVRDSAGYGFATLSGSDVVRYTGATTVGAALGADTVSTTNYRTTASGTFFNGSSTTQFLNSLDVAFNGDVSGNNAATYVLGSGGLMFSYSSGFPGYKANMNFTSATSELQVSVLPYNNGFASATIRSVADNGGTSVSLIKGGAGGLNMGSGTFTYTGDTVVNQGILDNIANIPSGTGKGNLVVNAQGIVALGLGASGTRTINGLSNTTLGGGIVNNQTYTSSAATAFLDLGNNNATATFSGVITGNFGIIKSGTGTQTLAGANSYTGSTTIRNGTLALGSLGTISNTLVLGVSGGTSGILDVSAKSAYTQNTVSGNGTINIGAGKTLSVTGAIAPGFSVGTINVTGNLSLGTSTAMELAGNGGVAGTDSDFLNVSGGITYAGGLVVTSFGGYDLTQSAVYNLFDFAGADVGQFSSVTVGGTPLAFASNAWTGTAGAATYTFSEGTGVLTVVVPEPAALGLVGVGLMGLVARRRRVA